jgi:hypothetical protein
MEEVFVTRASAIARIVAARKALQKDSESGSGAGTQDRALRLERLLVDVRSGRLADFRMPSERGEMRVFVTGD